MGRKNVTQEGVWGSQDGASLALGGVAARKCEIGFIVAFHGVDDIVASHFWRRFWLVSLRRLHTCIALGGVRV